MATKIDWSNFHLRREPSGVKNKLYVESAWGKFALYHRRSTYGGGYSISEQPVLLQIYDTLEEAIASASNWKDHGKVVWESEITDGD